MWILGAYALANLGVVNRVVCKSCADFGQAFALAEFAVPVEVSWAGSGGGRTDAVADLFAPVEANRAEVGIAEAAAFCGIIFVGSPVLGQRADACDADTFAVLGVPGLTSWACSWCAHTLADVGVKDFTGWACSLW